MGIDENTVKKVVERVLSVVRPERIIIFGSAATGQMTKDSDIDLLILKTAMPSNPREESVRIREALHEIRYPFDIIIMAVERFEESKNVIGGLAYPANKYGRVVYEAA